MIPYGRQNISESDIDAVVAILRSDFLTQGPAICRFEEAVAHRCGAKFAVAVSNATAALHIGALALGLSKGKRLWTSPNTFVASANCGLYCGAEVDFVDIDRRTYNMSPDLLEAKLIEARKAGQLPDVVVPVHFAGQSCDMRRIQGLAKEYKFAVMEDASHAVGARYLGSPVGSCEYSDMTVLSFHPVKIITTAEGGVVLTNRADLREKLLRLRSHGITRDPAQMEHVPEGPWSYEQVDLGYNYRITDMQAALGHSQLGRLEQFVTRRRELVLRYNEAFEGLPITLPWQHPDTMSSFHLYVIRLALSKIKKSRLEVFNELRRSGVGANVHYIPVHTQPYYRKLGFEKGQFPESESYYAEAISLPLYYDLSDADQAHVIAALKEAIA